MSKKAIQTDGAPAAVGPYSQGIAAGGFLFTAGQIHLTPGGELVEGDIESKTRQCLDNVRAVLRAAGADLDDLVKVTGFVTDMGQFNEINAAYAEYFEGRTPPARSFVQVAALPLGATIELEGVALLPNA